MRTFYRCLIAICVAGPLAASVTAREPSGCELCGSWIFEREVDTRADGSEIKLPMPPYEGVLIYTADGFVSATLMPRDRRWNVDSATREDLAASVGQGASTAYAGRYQVDRAARTVTHVPITSVDPGDVGRKLVRSYRLERDVLLLSGRFQHRGEELTFTVHWKRAAAARIGG